MSTPLSQTTHFEQPVGYWKGLYNRQKQLRIWDRQRHREELANLRLNYKHKCESKLGEFERHCNLKIVAKAEDFREKEAVYQRHIAKLEADLSRYSGSLKGFSQF